MANNNHGHHGHSHQVEEFDLLAGHDLADTNTFQNHDHHDQEEKILIWQKIETAGFYPSAREGHTSAAVGHKVYIFGGFETAKVNVLLIYQHNRL